MGSPSGRSMPRTGRYHAPLPAFRCRPGPPSGWDGQFLSNRSSSSPARERARALRTLRRAVKSGTPALNTILYVHIAYASSPLDGVVWLRAELSSRRGPVRTDPRRDHRRWTGGWAPDAPRLPAPTRRSVQVQRARLTCGGTPEVPDFEV